MSCKTFWNEVPKPIQIIVYTVLGVLAAFGFGLLFGWIVVWLWNWLMPMIFGLPTITFWQGVGIFILAKILFGGVSSHSESSKKRKKKEWSFELDSDKKKAGFDWGDGKFERKMENWEHYDEWWETQGKASFEQFTEQADADDEPEEDEQAKDE